MHDILEKFAQKLADAGLAVTDGPGAPLIGGLDQALVWNRDAPEIPVLEEVPRHLNINSLVFLRPRDPHATLIRFLAGRALKTSGRIMPKDCETRTFLHDLPVVGKFDAHAIIQALKQSKTVIVQDPDLDNGSSGPAVIVPGTVSPEQGFVHISSVCFACFVAFFSDYLTVLKAGVVDSEMDEVFDRVHPFLKSPPAPLPDLMKGPFTSEKEVIDAMCQAGRQIVAHDLVDSCFGNISCCWNKVLYISQTGSCLDELAGCIDPVPLDGSSSTGITASSELFAHLETIARTGCDVILHGHPRFSVILSMDCDPAQRAACDWRDRCHTHCPVPRSVSTTPIVPGEVGTGPYGLCQTLPRAFDRSDSVIVYGHGVFATGKTDFVQAFSNLAAVENFCKMRYLDIIGNLRGNCPVNQQP